MDNNYQTNLRPSNYNTKQQIQDTNQGALWIRKNDKGVEYFSIRLNLDGIEYNLKAFLNGQKTDSEADSKKPNFLIYESKNVPKNK